MDRQHAVATLALSAILALPAAGDHLLDNGTFDRDVAGWEARDDGAIGWSHEDAGDSAASGSLRIRDRGTAPALGAATYCVGQVTADETYVLDLSYLVPGGQRARTFVDFRFLMGPDCTGALAAGLNVDLPETAGGQWATSRKIVAAPATARSMRVTVGGGPAAAGGPLDVLFDDLLLAEVSTDCETTDTMLCIDNRFRVEVEFSTVQGGGAGGLARAIPAADLGMPRGGLFWFFTPDNPEMLVKVLDGCAANGHWWVFYSAVTNVGFRATVVDTVSGVAWSRSNPDTNPAQPRQDTAAFPCS